MSQSWPFRHNINKSKTQNRKKKDKNGAEKSTRKFYTVAIMHQKTHQKDLQLKEPTRFGMKEAKQYMDANKLANVRRDVLHKKMTNRSRN